MSGNTIRSRGVDITEITFPAAARDGAALVFVDEVSGIGFGFGVFVEDLAFLRGGGVG